MKPTRIIASAMLLAFVSSIISTTNYSLQGLWVQSLAAQNITQIDDSKPIDAEEVEPEEEKRLVVCIDQAVDEEGNPVEDGALNNAEGYWRAVMAERNNRDDVISVGGSLADCLDMVESEDCVVIVMHGKSMHETDEDGNVVKTDYGFTWGGKWYTGFGSGDGEHPLPDDAGDLDDVDIDISACFSDKKGEDREGNECESVADSLEDELGDDSEVGGAEGCVEYEVVFCVSSGPNFDGDSEEFEELLEAGDECLDSDSSWQNHPPVNDPNNTSETVTQEDAAQAQVDSCVGEGQLKITLPPNVADESDEKGYVPPVDTSDQN